MGNNPSPTNIAAGLSSIEEKSLGNIAKSGSGPIEGVIGYGAAPPAPGLWVMDAPAYAPESVTGFVAAGAQIILFTTGSATATSACLRRPELSANPEACATCANSSTSIERGLHGPRDPGGRRRRSRAPDARDRLGAPPGARF